MKKCLITGGAGFIGSHLAKHLIEEGCKVQIIDDLSSGSVNNFLPIKEHPNFSYILESAFNKNLMAELIDQADEIYHLAAAVGVKMIVEDSSKTIHVNYHLTEIVLEHAAKKGKPILFTSTSEVYGKSNQIPFKEDGDLLLGSSQKWRWAYACSKLLDEFMVLSRYNRESVPVVIARLFNTVGPGQTGRYGMVIPTFVRQALLHKPITIYGSGEQTRCFCHVHDIIPQFPLLLRNKKAHGEIFNLGSQEEISILKLAQAVKEITQSNSEIIHIPYDKAYNKGFEDMMRRVPALDKVKELTNFEPKKSLKDIIEDVKVDMEHQLGD